ncbi:hypothetical protein [Aestuariivirga sp.]|uniref:hypothetical protein n=1 Tax=Aestuariivirga sp. TaxID=2650926 RepID=UPI0039E28A04
MITRRSALLACLALAACGDDSKTPYLEFIGGGFIFNYRTADHYYGFVARRKKPLPEGAVLEASFEVPGGPNQVLRETSSEGKLQYTFQTGDLRGIEKGHPYKAVLRVLDGTSGAELARYEKTFTTEVDETSLPEGPLVVGPGYQQPAPQ